MPAANVITASDIHNASITFQPPVPAIGQTVVVYLDGVKDDRRRVVGTVNRILNKTIGVSFIGSSEGRANVKHIDDPRLQMHQSQQESGAWDFTDDWYESMKSQEYVLNKMEEMFRRLEAVEAALDIKPEKGAQASANQLRATEFHALRKKARGLGCEDAFRMNKSELSQWIEEFERKKQEAEEAAKAAKERLAKERAEAKS